MSLKTQLTKARFLGDGQAREWPLPFPVMAAEHVHVIETDIADGRDIPRTKNYEVVGLGTDKVRVVFPVAGAPLPSGKRLTIHRLVPYIQEMDVENGAAFDAEVVENQLDTIVMQIQQLGEALERSVKLPIASEQTGDALLDAIYQARDDAATETAKSAAFADNAAASAALANTAQTLVRQYAERAEGARDVAFGQVNAANTLMETELAKINALVAANHDDQQRAVEEARNWAEAGEPVRQDEDGAFHYSARHYAEAAREAAGGLATPATDADPATGRPVLVYPDGKTSTMTAEGMLAAVPAPVPPPVPLGDMALKPFRPEDLATACPGWHFMNGDRYPLDSPVGAALAALPENFKTDWGIASDGETISIPNFFDPEGRGFFLRSTDGGVTPVGGESIDTMRPITGHFTMHNGGGVSLGIAGLTFSGAFYGKAAGSLNYPTRGNAAAAYWPSIDSGRLGPNFSGTETAPLAKHMTPVIFLGV